MQVLTFEPAPESEKREAEGPQGFPAAGTVRDGSLVGISPVDERDLPSIAVSSVEAVRSTVRRARAAQPVWASLPLSERTRRLRKAAGNMLRDRATALRLIREETGKSEAEALFSEALGPLDQVNGWAAVVQRAMRPERVSLNPLAFPCKRATVEPIPRGVIGAVAPWNFPLATFFRCVFPALLTGNAIVVKPSEYTPRVANWFVSHLQDELALEVLDAVHGKGEVGRALIDAGIDACTFTGSVASGREVIAHCARLMIPVNVELGGKDSAIILADCDLDRTIAGVTHWALSNAGQSCGAIELALVDERIADRFVSRMADAWKRLKAGPTHAAVYDVAPLAHLRQLDAVEEQVRDALARGATLVCGGRRTRAGLGYEPTLLSNCDESMAVVREETFGPVLPVVRVSGIDEALRITNNSRYGLTASIWTSDTRRAERIAERLEVGTVTINNHALTGAIPSLPWSGTRDSGYGVANSRYALSTYLRPRTVLVDQASIPDPYWMPFDDVLSQLGEVLADLQVARLSGLPKLPWLLYQRIARTRRFYGM